MSDQVYVLIHAKTKHVLGVVTRAAADPAPTAAQVVGESLELRDPVTGAELFGKIPASELAVEQVAYDARLIARMQFYTCDDGVVQAPTAILSAPQFTGATFKATIATTNPAECEAWVHIEGDGVDFTDAQTLAQSAGSITTKPGTFPGAKDYRVICLVQNQRAFIATVHHP